LGSASRRFQPFSQGDRLPPPAGLHEQAIHPLELLVDQDRCIVVFPRR
jgi:hypothetical protein